MRVLVVEDDRELSDSLGRGLRAAGYTVDIAPDGWYGEQLAASGEYAIILLDLMMPRRNGFQVCTSLRRSGNVTPILVLTAKDGVYDQTEALDSGADDYLVKPFRYEVLLARIRALVRRSHTASPSTTVTVGDLELEPISRTCSRGGRAIELTALEFVVLFELARHPGRVLSKTELLRIAWPREPDDVNLVEARVSALRRKIDVPFRRHSLQTVRGAGYRLVDDLLMKPARRNGARPVAGGSLP